MATAHVTFGEDCISLLAHVVKACLVQHEGAAGSGQVTCTAVLTVRQAPTGPDRARARGLFDPTRLPRTWPRRSTHERGGLVHEATV